jgi:hypothetical protein
MRCLRTRRFEFPGPALVNTVERDRIEEMPLLASLPPHRDKIRLLEKFQVPGYRLACHAEPSAQVPQSLATLLMQAIEKTAATRISERPEDPIAASGGGRERLSGGDRLYEAYYMRSNTCSRSLPVPEADGCCVAQVLLWLVLVDDRRLFKERMRFTPLTTRA